MPTDIQRRLDRVREVLRARDLTALLITPGANLRYLTGYHGHPETERITCLVVGADGSAHLLAPVLEVPLVEASGAADLDVPIVGWAETDDSIATLAGLVPATSGRVAVDERMWAARSLALRAARPGLEQVDAAPVLRELRIRKSAEEIESLRRAAAAIDSVHAEMGQWLRAGRTEREIGADVADAILSAGHRSADFVIVASGPNGASPHADVSDRVVSAGEPVVVDIGGSMPDGYCSDSTRVYSIGEPPEEFRRSYEVLLAAQRAQCAAARPGLRASELDALGRRLIADAGYGELFIHRTGHGIGLDTHEDPYIVEGNDLRLEPGMAFSVEPGIYHPGTYGARIEDIVVCTADGAERLNRRPRELAVLA
jgi:Xaa-Pro aminopeptidase